MRRLKADFHAHTADDPIDHIGYSAEMFINAAAARGFDVVTVSCHCRLMRSERLGRYALERGMVLIPAIEQRVEGKHVVMLNPDDEQAQARTFAELRQLGRRAAVFVAAHPYYPGHKCLGDSLAEHIDLFDALEYSNFYRPWLNFNKKAGKMAARHGLPMLGTSDSHVLPLCDSTYSLVECEATVAGVIDAIRQGRVEVKTSPRPAAHIFEMMRFSIRQALRDLRMISE